MATSPAPGAGSNRLAREKSPYLLQHASNPVDWYPWGEEAFAAARSLDRPVFVSIGYATCHWCHVMERESFEDREVARLMNGAFVNIKVDREERPDLDHLYMTVCQALTGSGGWPLTVVMTPDKKPFFAGTYFPRQNRFGRIGMTELVPRIARLWREKRGDAERTSEEILSALRRPDPPEGAGPPPAAQAIESGFDQMAGQFDGRNGGFGRAPKFPQAGYLLHCLRHWRRRGDGGALRMVEQSLVTMRLGGVYDQVGHGFHRYSTDERWLLPHFEKMLYDQALLGLAYTEAWRATKNPFFRRTAGEVFSYVLRDLRLEGGGFASAEDADSEGEEGRFYLWSLGEVRQVLGPDAASLAARVFHLEEEGNFTGETGQRSGGNIPHRLGGLPLGPGEEEALEEARTRLLAMRERRVRPLRDDKVLTDWNGLVIASLARAGAAFGDPALVAAAEGGARFVATHLRRPDGDLIHRWREGEASLPAHLDDYAFFAWGLIELYQATFTASYLAEALDVTGRMLSLFGDPGHGGLFFTALGGEELPLRQKIFEDGSVPSGNSVAAMNLLRLSRLTADPALEQGAAAIVAAAGPLLAEHPAALCHLLGALDFASGDSSEVVIVAGEDRGGAEEMIGALRQEYLPNTVIHRLAGQKGDEDLFGCAPFLREYLPGGAKAAAYVCRRGRCAAPVSGVDEIMDLLGEKSGPPPGGREPNSPGDSS